MKRLTRQEMIDSRVIFFGGDERRFGVGMNRAQYDTYQSLGYGDGRPWDEIVIEMCPQLATEETFHAMYPDNP